MKSILDRYLDRILVYANKSESESEAIRKELKDHLLQKVDDLAKCGLSREEATLEALRRHGAPKVVGYGLRGPFPWIDIRSHGTARGVIAIGPKAIGVFAFGGVAVGVVACGTFAVGIFSSGLFAVGLLLAWAFLGVGGVANAFISVGVVASGAAVIGLVVDGGQAVGLWVPAYESNPHFATYFTAENVPWILRSLEPILRGCNSFDRYVFTAFLPAYLCVIPALGYLKYREGKRVTSSEDWIVDG
jgi:hypothetical protein